METIMKLVRNASSGASSFALFRTTSNARSNVPDAGTVAVAPLSKAYGTSTPSTLRPSVRRNATCTCEIVTSLFVLGATVLPAAPMSLGERRSVATAVSEKIVGHGVASVHGAGVVTSVMTSDASGTPGWPGVAAPLTP